MQPHRRVGPGGVPGEQHHQQRAVEQIAQCRRARCGVSHEAAGGDDVQGEGSQFKLFYSRSPFTPNSLT